VHKRPIAAVELDAAVVELEGSPDGRHLAAGDMEGGVHVLEIAAATIMG
jgi:hypothetical protein